MKIKNLSFKFDHTSDYFFKSLSVEFAPNQINFIQGSNGVGKSTLFSILQGNTHSGMILEGSVELDNTSYEIKQNILDPKFTQQVKTVQQQFDRMLANNFTFMQNLQLANLPTYPKLKSLPDVQNLPALVEKLNIPLATPAKLLSGGQRQILAILMAIQKPTKVLLLDEPTATLDQKNASMVIEFLQELVEQLQITVLIICHDKELINKYSQYRAYSVYEEPTGLRSIKKEN